MFDVVVWATDGSSTADAALPFVQKLVNPDGGRVVVVHGNEIPFVGASGATRAPRRPAPTRRRCARRSTRRWKSSSAKA